MELGKKSYDTFETPKSTTLEFKPSGQYRHENYVEYDSVEGTLAIITDVERESLTGRPIEDDLRNENGQIVVSSRMVAERFGKRHDNVIQNIESITTENQGLINNYFIPSTYTAGTGKRYKEYLMNRKGFTLLAMGFTGREALQFKMAYIEAFERMEEALKNQSPAVPQDYEEAVVALLGQIRETKQLQLELKAKEEAIQEMKPKSEYCERILKSKGTVTTTFIAKDYGMSAKKLNEILKTLGIQHKTSGAWVLNQPYAEQGYLKSYTGTNENRYGEEYAYVGTNWTQKGRMFIYEQLKNVGILPLLEQTEQ